METGSVPDKAGHRITLFLPHQGTVALKKSNEVTPADPSGLHPAHTALMHEATGLLLQLRVNFQAHMFILFCANSTALINVLFASRIFLENTLFLTRVSASFYFIFEI